jgi:hypothetical protein
MKDRREWWNKTVNEKIVQRNKEEDRKLTLFYQFITIKYIFIHFYLVATLKLNICKEVFTTVQVIKIRFYIQFQYCLL